MPGAAAGMNGYLNTRELQLYGYWLSDRLPSPSADLEKTHTDTRTHKLQMDSYCIIFHWDVTNNSKEKLWFNRLSHVCLALKMLGCLSAELNMTWIISEEKILLPLDGVKQVTQ